MRFFVKDHNVEVLRDQLLYVTNFLDESNIVYHLEGGTLLGYVRQGSILPWDHDADISVMASNKERLMALFATISRKWRVSYRYFETDHPFAKKGDLRIIKVRDRFAGFMKGPNTLDIFIKYEHESNVFWRASGNIMSVKSDYYEGYEELKNSQKVFKVPCSYKDYLTDKYGDWSKEVREWSCSQEKTIVQSLSEE